VGVKLVVVDEVQDSETSRLELLLALLRASRDQLKVEPELLAVGDELQRIYCLAGEGSYRWLEQTLPGAYHLELEEQYRYGPTINAAANRIAAALGCDKPVRPWREWDDPAGHFQRVLAGQAALPDLVQGQLPIALFAAEDENEEALFLAGEIYRLQTLIPSACIGVLVYRQKQLQLIAAAIKERNLEFHIKTREIDRETGQGESLNVSSNRVVIKPEEEKEPKINLMTIHAAKGLAFDVVILPGLAHGLFPGNASDARRDLMLLMVGLTRTRFLVYLSYPKVAVNQAGRMERAGPSPFLSLLPPIIQGS
jgi:superfamily I DNA/RNA helicase